MAKYTPGQLVHSIKSNPYPPCTAPIIIPHQTSSLERERVLLNINMACTVFVVGIFFLLFSFNFSEAQMVPAMFVFGDSLVDVGNNNYLELSLAKANIPHYGIDFPAQKPTGRFSNGKNAADFLGKLNPKSSSFSREKSTPLFLFVFFYSN